MHQAPVQRTLGVTLYGASTVSAIRNLTVPLTAGTGGTTSGVTPILPLGP